MLTLFSRAAFAAAILMACAAVHAATVEEISKALESSMEKIKTVSYEQTNVMEMKNAQISMNSTGTSTIEMKKKGDIWMMRTEGEETRTQTMMGNTTETKTKTLSVMDGEAIYMYSESNGQKQAYKSKISKEKAPKMNMLDAFKEQFNFKVLPDATEGGQDCYVIECTPKGQQGAGTTMTISLAKSCGMMMKMVNKMPQGATTTITTKNLKLDPAIAADRFVFKAPEGVTVQEMPNMGGK